jgi:hypothetical protein
MDRQVSGRREKSKESGSVPIGSGWRSSWAFPRGSVFRRRVELEVGFSVEEETGLFKE